MAGTQASQTVAKPSVFDLQQSLLDNFSALTKEIEQKIHLFATDGGDERLSQVALDVTKQLFDLGVGLEEHSHAHIQPFLAAIAQPTGIALRSSSKKDGKAEEEDKRLKPEEVLPHTPLSELTTDGLEHEQVWQQMELRAPGYVRVAKEITSGEEPAEAMGMDEVELSESDAGSADDDEEMTEEEFRAMLAEQGMDDLTDEEIAKMMEDAEDSEAEDDSEDDDSEEVDSEDEEEEDEDDEDMLSGSEEDEVEFEDGTKIGGSDDEDEELELGSQEDDGDDVDVEMDDDDEDDEEEDEEDDDSAESEEDEDEDAPGPSRPRRSRQHPTLDDQFFSIDDFNRVTEEAEASHLSSGRLNDDEEEDGDLEEDVGEAMLRGADEDEPIMYGDFFDAPRTVQKPSSAKAKDTSEKSKGKGKGRQARFDDEDEEEEENDDDEDEEEAREVMGRFKEDLFADDDEDDEEQPEQALSTHEKRQRQLEEQIAQLEQEAVGPKDWTLMGEASARARPENSLLEQDLDFEHVQKVTPVITEETVRTLEELIKKRILDNDFNSTVRVRAYEPTPFLPSRYFDLQDTQSSKSLAQIYEEEYQDAAAGGKAVDARDAKLQKDHQEIEDLWTEICYKLDALSSLNFVPKQPKAQITTISNMPTTSMETALPAASSTSTMLAPEELFQPATQSSLVARSELTPEEAQRQRERKRKAKKQQRKHLGDMAELYAKKDGKKAGAGGTKGEKERALAGLVKSGRGVTVVGKSDKELGKAAKRGAPGDADAGREDGKRLKL